MITISQASWQYTAAERPTMEGVDLVIEPGETVVLCGASGSGKSTLLRMMNGLIPHFHEGTLSGRVTVSGLDVRKSALDELGRRTGTVLQHPRRQFFTATVIDELSFALENFGAAPADIRARVNMLMRRLALQAIMERPLPQLSGGQQQRVAIAAGLGHDPGALLLDEPSSNLSADAVSTLAGTLAELRERGITIVISEHRLHYLTGIADRFVLLERGRIAHSWWNPPSSNNMACGALSRPRCPSSHLSRRPGRALRRRRPVRPSDRPRNPEAAAAVSSLRTCAACSRDARSSPLTRRTFPLGP